MGTNTNNSSEPTPAASTGKTPAATTEVVTSDMQAVESSQLWSQKLRDKLPAFWAKCCQACLKTGPALLFTLALALSSNTSHAFQNVPLAERSPTAQNSSEAYTQSSATNSISATTNNTVEDLIMPLHDNDEEILIDALSGVVVLTEEAKQERREHSQWYPLADLYPRLSRDQKMDNIMRLRAAIKPISTIALQYPQLRYQQRFFLTEDQLFATSVKCLNGNGRACLLVGHFYDSQIYLQRQLFPTSPRNARRADQSIDPRVAIIVLGRLRQSFLTETSRYPEKNEPQDSFNYPLLDSGFGIIDSSLSDLHNTSNQATVRPPIKVPLSLPSHADETQQSGATEEQSIASLPSEQSRSSEQAQTNPLTPMKREDLLPPAASQQERSKLLSQLATHITTLHPYALHNMLAVNNGLRFGQAYVTERNLVANFLHALVYYRLGCNLSNRSSCAMLANIKGRLGSEILLHQLPIFDTALGIDYLHNGCFAGDSVACANLGILYFNGMEFPSQEELQKIEEMQRLAATEDFPERDALKHLANQDEHHWEQAPITKQNLTIDHSLRVDITDPDQEFTDTTFNRKSINMYSAPPRYLIKPDLKLAITMFQHSCDLVINTAQHLRPDNELLGLGCYTLGRIYLGGTAVTHSQNIKPHRTVAINLLRRSCDLQYTPGCELTHALFLGWEQDMKDPLAPEK